MVSSKCYHWRGKKKKRKAHLSRTYDTLGRRAGMCILKISAPEDSDMLTHASVRIVSLGLKKRKLGSDGGVYVVLREPRSSDGDRVWLSPTRRMKTENMQR